MNDTHKACRVLLGVTLAAMKTADPLRHVQATVGSKLPIGLTPTYFIEVVDSRDPCTGTKWPSEGAPGHHRNCTYEVQACCANAARVEAISAHERAFAVEADEREEARR